MVSLGVRFQGEPQINGNKSNVLAGNIPPRGIPWRSPRVSSMTRDSKLTSDGKERFASLRPRGIPG